MKKFLSIFNKTNKNILIIDKFGKEIKFEFSTIKQNNDIIIIPKNIGVILKDNFTYENLKELRQLSGCGLNDCKRVLSYTNNDIELAFKFLRSKSY